MTIRDDATPEELDRWYRRTTEEIEEERARKAYDAWAALRTPDHLTHEPDTLSGGGGNDALLGGSGRDQARPRAYVAPTVTALDPYQRALLDAAASTEASGYDILYSPYGTPRRIRRGADGQPDYSRHPNDPAQITSGPNKGKRSSAAGRYQFIKPTWDGLSKTHSDLADFSPGNQDKGAWYVAWERYARETGGRDLGADLRDPRRYGDITGVLRKEWTSLPGGIEQGQGPSEFERRMQAGVRRYQRVQ